MLQSEIVEGFLYKAKVNETIVTVRVDKIEIVKGRKSTGLGRKGTPASIRYYVTNLKTGRTTTFKSAAKFRSAVEQPKKVVNATTIPKKDWIELDVAEVNRRVVEGAKKKGLFDEQEDEQGSDPTSAPSAEGVDDKISRSAKKVETLAVDAEERGLTTSPANGTPKQPRSCENGSPKGGLDSSPIPTTTSNQPEPATVSVRPASNLSALTAKFLPTKPQPTKMVPHLECPALAGTGKTTTMIKGLIKCKGGDPKITPSPQQEAIWESMESGDLGSVRLSSFSSGITGELKAQVLEAGLHTKGVEALGIHGLGYRTLLKALGRSVEPNNFAVEDITGGILGGNAKDLKRIPGMAEAITGTNELVSLCKATLSEPTPDNLDRLTSRYTVDLGKQRNRIYELVPQVLELCKTPKNRISFDDQIWLPLVYDLTIPKVDTQIVDESQDLNRMQQELMLRAGHRIIFVGDRHQAIYGFAGADAESMDRMRAELGGCPAEGAPLGAGLVGYRGCTSLPLTVTRRCSKAVVAEARRYVPEYEAHPSNPQGDILRARYPVQGRGEDRVLLPWKETYAAKCVGGDLVLCRTNAPLVHECFAFLRENITANILGKKIGEGLVRLVNKLKPASVVDLIKKLDEWTQQELERENAKKEPSETKLEEICDKRAVIMVFIEGCQNVSDVVNKISARFTDDPKVPGIRLATIHKAKGLEAENVHWLRPPGIGPRRDKMQDWELEQEENLEYVATTRAKLKLTYVS